MSRKTKEEAEKTRTRILASALSLFARKGYDHTTFTDIASRLHLTKGAVYWHFESKEKLLVALVEIALKRFQRQIEALMPRGELTFPAVAKMMIANTASVVEDPKGAAFFRLMKCQVKWASEDMQAVRHDLFSDVHFGPKEAFKRAIANDIAAGRVRAETNAEAVACVCLAIWDGLVQSRLDHFLTCDLNTTIYGSFAAIWAHMCNPGMAERYPF